MTFITMFQVHTDFLLSIKMFGIFAVGSHNHHQSEFLIAYKFKLYKPFTIIGFSTIKHVNNVIKFTLPFHYLVYQQVLIEESLFVANKLKVL